MSSPSSQPAQPERRAFLRQAGGLLLGGGAVAGLGGGVVWQSYRFDVVRERHTLRGLARPLRLALLTDLHFGLYIGLDSVRHWVEVTLRERPDLILLGGDLLDMSVAASSAPLLQLMQELGRLQAPLGVYAVWGNHDYGSFGRYGSRRRGPARTDWEAQRAAFGRQLAQHGIQVLRNEGRALRPDLWLGGVDDLWYGEPNVQAALSGAGTRASILLSHNPDQLLEFGRSRRPDLMLSGHTHGGQVRLPLLGALKVPAEKRFAQGWVTEDGVTAYVSRGLGMSGIPLRLLCEAELTLLTLEP